jgi:hypothetical protein
VRLLIFGTFDLFLDLPNYRFLHQCPDVNSTLTEHKVCLGFKYTKYKVACPSLEPVLRNRDLESRHLGGYNKVLD